MKRAVIITSYLEHPMDIKPLLREGDLIVCLDGGYDIALEQGIQPDILMGDFDSIRAEIPDDGDIQVLRYPPEKDFSDLELALRLLDPRDQPEILIIGGIGGRQDQTIINMHLITRYSRPVEIGNVANPDPRLGPEDSSRSFSRIDIMDSRNHCFAVHGITIKCCGALVSDPVPHDGDAEGAATGPVSPDEDRAEAASGFQDRTPSERSAPGNPSPDGQGLATPVAVTIPAETDSYLSLVPMTDFCEDVTLAGVKYPLKKALLRRGSSLSISNEFTDPAATLSILTGSLLVIISRK